MWGRRQTRHYPATDHSSEVKRRTVVALCTQLLLHCCSFPFWKQGVDKYVSVDLLGSGSSFTLVSFTLFLFHKITAFVVYVAHMSTYCSGGEHLFICITDSTSFDFTLCNSCDVICEPQLVLIDHVLRQSGLYLPLAVKNKQTVWLWFTVSPSSLWVTDPVWDRHSDSGHLTSEKYI